MALLAEGAEGGTALARWAEFYLIIGTSAAALTGLQFVVQSLLATDLRQPANGTDPEAPIAAFVSPTVVHFTMALVISCGMSVPWPGIGSLRVFLAGIGTAALLYSLVVLRRTKRQPQYQPVFEDWLWHVLLPFVAYGAVLGAAIPSGDPAMRLFLVGGATLLLVCVGIHNAWDMVTYLTVSAMRREARKD